MKYAVYACYCGDRFAGWYRVPMSGGRFKDRKVDWHSAASKSWRPSAYEDMRGLIEAAKKPNIRVELSVINVEFKHDQTTAAA